LFVPLGIDFSSYHMVFDNPMIGRGYLNTLLYVMVGTIVNVSMTILGAYVLSRRGLFWGRPMRFFVVFTMFFSGGMIPFYLTVENMGLMNNLLALILPYAINPMNLIIMRTSFMSLPVALEESASLEGANELILLLKIIIPLSMPVIAVMILFYGVGHWNSWFSAMMFIRDRTKLPLQMILREILIMNSTEGMMTGVSTAEKAPLTETIKYATIMVATVPILFVYPFLQRFFVKGVMVGAIKE
jgi:putative aldouronate transport system permease protein